MFAIFARPKPCRILLLLKDTEVNWHLSKIAKNSDTTYVYVTKLMTKLQKDGVVTIDQKGKKKLVKLTEKGIKIANIIEEMKGATED